MLAKQIANTQNFFKTCENLENHARSLVASGADKRICDAVKNLRYSLGVFCTHEGDFNEDEEDNSLRDLTLAMCETVYNLDMIIANEQDSVNSRVSDIISQVTRECSTLQVVFAISDAEVEK